MAARTLEADNVRRLITAGTDALGLTNGKHDLAYAEFCYRLALELLHDVEPAAGPMIATAWDGLGFVYELQDRLEEAETCYLKSLAAQQAADWPPQVCDDLTLLRLGQLYGRTGKRNLQLAVINRMRAHQTCSCLRNAERIL